MVAAGWPSWLVDALMMLQYEFPLTPTPYSDVAERLGVDVGVLLEWLQRLQREGVVKRVGFHVDPRVFGYTTALASFQAREPRKTLEVLRSKLHVTHAYLRCHPHYNLWVVVRAHSLDELVEAVKTASLGGGWAVYPPRRLWRLSVKYDLYAGTSRAAYKTLPGPARLDQLGELDTRLLRGLQRLPIAVRPYQKLARELGLSEGEVVGEARRLLEQGVLHDPGLVLDGWRLGYRYNAMVILWGDASKACEWVVDNVPEATHVVERYTIPGGREACFAMVHARGREKLGEVLDRFNAAPAEAVEVAESVGELQPTDTTS